MATTSLMTRRAQRGWAASAAAVAVAALFATVSFCPADAQQPKPRKGVQTAPPPGAIPAGAQGVWIDHTGRGAVEIMPCAALPPAGTAPPPQPKANPSRQPKTNPSPQPSDAQNLCGRIVWLQNPNDDKGKPLIDDLNKNPAKRGGPICGLQIIGEVKPQSDGSWDKGWIYDPEQGSSFDVELRLSNPETLQVKGYMGVKFLSETYVWHRAKQAPPKCPGI